MTLALLGQPPAYIIMTYVLGLMMVTLALFGAIRFLNINVTLFTVALFNRSFTVTMALFGILFLFAILVVNLFCVLNVMIGAEKHVFDKIILFMLFPLNAFLPIILVWGGRRFIRDV